MRTLLITAILFLGLNAFASDAHLLMSWDPEIPTSAQNVLERLTIEANYFSFDTDEGRCGGDILSPELMAHTSYETEDGNEIHEVVIAFDVEKPVNYCQSIEVVHCQATVQVFSIDSILLADWTCED